ncbi:hypothetical protein RHSIM_RhsimUnG0255700 [Rhododendron simsii]|uniref:Serine-threonine/tyrosine-protein kinase catalytic domain-containing protein n=1 Tax=Rhododendron simsii TaxID=118357 RepID=A0A834L378_RHOSS|nr:hypothetical protein RHSIM_RhsimUnG0255700 [Rhododendron simsii]
MYLLIRISMLLCINNPNQSTLYGVGKDLLSFDLCTSIGAGNNTLTETSKSKNSRKREVDLPWFSFASVSAATDHFSDANKLGEGGFGPIYKMIGFVLESSGYMSPEYALEGFFSVKSDVFSFGVLLLEILSGKRNTGFYNSDSLNLLGYQQNSLRIRRIVSVSFLEEGMLKLSNAAILVLINGINGINGINDIIWYSNNTSTSAPDPIVQLLDSGNLVVRKQMII